ncbi:gamma carbonic anhydrase family protein [Pseudonocardia oroxyli]|uniref:Carbonic anhydrase or acetyltransferase, isoleucine patch superfamily n=1 Tax=Pseudonocardia oroxyli TaxID=366584 RepID=A0A1G7FKK3_PSEOR|nr:gamma carbonic anhydrase family protein [Pseudonocardia oroxyli]SDE76369.1 Carbonic anhydrase or acetyltransferase, isoleucine patch superfamily [Pseudonocardia oroxyli]
MPLFEFEGRRPSVHPTAFVAPTAALIGDVRVEAGASVWYNAVLRGDTGPIIVREGANVQDGSVLHGGEDPATEIGAGATIGHLCVVHGCVIGPECVIGNGATVQDRAVIGARSLVGAGALVAPGKVIPEGTLVLGATASPRGPLTSEAEWWVQNNPGFYRELAQRHARTVAEI